MKRDLETMGCDINCPAYALCKKRVLIVGGITKLASLYQQVVEKNGGTFEYHDGYMKSGSRKLQSRLRRADVVLCPVNCNSHAACFLVKKLAKKYKKRLHMLPSASLSTIARALA
jgi:phosphoheptose isomerase